MFQEYKKIRVLPITISTKRIMFRSKKAETIASIINLQEMFAKKSFLGMNYVPGVQKDQGFTYHNLYEKDNVQNQLLENAQVPIANMSDEFKSKLVDSVGSLENFKNVLDTFGGDSGDNIRGYLQ